MVLNFKLEYSGRFDNDITNIRNYISDVLKNPLSAAEKISRIMLAAESLKFFPKLYRVRGRDSQRNEIRILPVDNYLILYSVDDEKQIVSVSRVIYGRKNIHLLFAPEY